MLTRLPLRLVFPILLIAGGGCATAPVPELASTPQTLPAIAAQLRTEFSPRDGHAHEHDRQEMQWRLWREPTRVVTENLTSHTGEVWQLDGNATFHQKVFHEDRRTVEYQSDDLRMNNMSVPWARQSMLIAPEHLQGLTLKKSGWKDGYPFRRYVGTVDDTRWDVTMRVDLGIPVKMVRASREGTETTQLMSVSQLRDAPWQPTSADGYEAIDFADLGDRQADPFVVKVQDQLGRPHVH